jgi:GntR family transcriptional regulator/MocR family aminotransferase
MRPRYRARRDALVAALARELPDWRLTGIAAGLHTVALLPEAVDEAAFLAAAKTEDLRLHGLSWFRVAAGPPGLVLGYGGTSEPAIERAVTRLARVAAAVEPGPTAREPGRARRRTAQPAAR